MELSGFNRNGAPVLEFCLKTIHNPILKIKEQQTI